MSPRRSEKIRVVHCKVGQAPVVVEVEDKLSAYQALVGGLIELTRAHPDSRLRGFEVWINEEGRFCKLPPNRFVHLSIGATLVLGDFYIGWSRRGEPASIPLDDAAEIAEWIGANWPLWREVHPE